MLYYVHLSCDLPSAGRPLLDLAIEQERLRDALTILRGMTSIPAPIVEGHPCPDTLSEKTMDTIKDFELKDRKYIPVFPKASGKPTIYIQGYPCEDDKPMPGTDFHGIQINTFYEQLARYFEIHTDIYVGYDNFIYYEEGRPDKSVAPDVYVVLGVEKVPPRRSFYMWAEGAVPTAVFEFLSDSTAHQDRNGKVCLYLIEIGVEEYFLHQPDPNRPSEFRGWRRSASGGIVEIAQDGGGGLFSESLNLWLRWEERENNVRLLRPYLPDGTAITTSVEEKHLRLEAQEIAAQEAERRREEAQRRREAETIAREATQRQQEAETLARAEAQRRQEAEAELERLRAQLANRQDEGA